MPPVGSEPSAPSWRWKIGNCQGGFRRFCGDTVIFSLPGATGLRLAESARALMETGKPPR